MKHDTKFDQSIAFQDILFNFLMAFAFLFVLAFMLINKPTKNDAKLDTKAEALVIMTWPEWAVEDIDLWMKLPDNDVISFQRKTGKLINLERDDRGMWSDFTIVDGKPIVSSLNKEVIVFRAMVPGKYTVSAHFYSTGTDYPPFAMPALPPNIPKPPYPVKVELVQLNPVYNVVATSEVIVEERGQEKPALTFTITSEGTFTNVEKSGEPFIAEKSATGTVPRPPGGLMPPGEIIK